MSLVEFGGRDNAGTPMVVCIAPDASDRRRVLEAVERLGVVVVVAPDRRSMREAFARGTSLDLEEDAELSRDQVVVAGDLEIDRERAEVRWRGRIIDLTQRELALLAHVAREPGRVWSFAQLNHAVWRSHYLGDPSAVHAAVKRLRRKLRLSGVTASLDAVRGVGFRLRIPPIDS